MPLEPGDKVLVYIDEKRRFVIVLEEDGILGTDKGYIKHSDIIGRDIGEAVYTSRGFKAYLLKPTISDYLHVFKRATQVIYPKDSSLMIYLSGIGPGSRVVEAGVGTGFLTLSLANIVGDNGRVYGYDIKKQNLEIARRNLELAGLGSRVELYHADIRSGVHQRNVDAVFLDMPDPWNALEAVYKALKPSAPILVYVPTINQVEKTVLAMRRTNCFIAVKAMETLVREYIVNKEATRPKTLMIGHTGYIIFGRKVIDPTCAYQ